MPRSADQLLENVYSRARQIRRRRTAGITAGSASFAAVAVAIALTQLTGVVSPPGVPVDTRADAPRIDQPTVTPETSRPAPGPCSCTANPTRRPLRRGGPGNPPPIPERAGYLLAFASDRDGDFDIYTMEASGKGLRRLTNDPAPERDPEWSPDGSRIAFVRLSSISEGIGAIYVMDADGSNVRFVADGLAPKWSPDGRQLAYHTHPGVYGESFGGVWVVNADGSGKRLVTRDAGDPDWARDGRRLILGVRINGAVNVHTVALDGSGRTRLTNDPAYACEPDVSPDGTAVAYVSSIPTRLHVMDIDGSNAVPVGDSVEWDFAPSWSHDARFIAFERDPDADIHYVGVIGGAAGPAKPRILIARSDGSGEVALTFGEHADADPSFAPRRS